MLGVVPEPVIAVTVLRQHYHDTSNFCQSSSKGCSSLLFLTLPMSTRTTTTIRVPHSKSLSHGLFIHTQQLSRFNHNENSTTDNVSSTATRHNMTMTTIPSMLAPIRIEAGQVGLFETVGQLLIGMFFKNFNF